MTTCSSANDSVDSYNELVASVGVQPTRRDVCRLSKTVHYLAPKLTLNRLLMRIMVQPKESLLNLLQNLKSRLDAIAKIKNEKESKTRAVANNANNNTTNDNSNSNNNNNNATANADSTLDLFHQSVLEAIDELTIGQYDNPLVLNDRELFNLNSTSVSCTRSKRRRIDESYDDYDYDKDEDDDDDEDDDEDYYRRRRSVSGGGGGGGGKGSNNASAKHDNKNNSSNNTGKIVHSIGNNSGVQNRKSIKLTCNRYADSFDFEYAKEFDTRTECVKYDCEGYDFRKAHCRALEYRAPYVFHDRRLDRGSFIGPLTTVEHTKSLIATVAGVPILLTAQDRFLMFKAVLFRCIQMDRMYHNEDERVLTRLECLIDDRNTIANYDFVEYFLRIMNRGGDDNDNDSYCGRLKSSLTSSFSPDQMTESTVNYASLMYTLDMVDYNRSLLKCNPRVSRSDCEYIFSQIHSNAPNPVNVDRCVYTINQIVKCFPEVGVYKVAAHCTINTKQTITTVAVTGEVLTNNGAAAGAVVNADTATVDTDTPNNTSGTLITFTQSDTSFDTITSYDYCSILEYAKRIVNLTFKFGNFEILQLALRMSPFNINDAANIQLTMTRTNSDIDLALVLTCLWQTLIGQTCDLSYLFNVLCVKYTGKTPRPSGRDADKLLRFVLFECNKIKSLPIDVEYIKYAVDSLRKRKVKNIEERLFYATFFRAKESELAKYYHDAMVVYNGSVPSDGSVDVNRASDDLFQILKTLYITSIYTSPSGKRLIDLLKYKTFDSNAMNDNTLLVEGKRLPFSITTTDHRIDYDECKLFDWQKENGGGDLLSYKRDIVSELEYRIFTDYYLRSRDERALHLL